jgi:hypothetical protein
VGCHFTLARHHDPLPGSPMRSILIDVMRPFG